jgi:hypothetical protein
MTLRNSITAKQQLALDAFIGGANVGDAAQIAGVGRKTVTVWLHHSPLFTAAMKQAESEALEGLSRKLVTLGLMAGAALEYTLMDESVPMILKLRAADIVLARLLQMRELVQLEARVDALELQAKLKDGK